MMYVLGIDGGGTKTKGVIATENGEIIAETVVGATNPNNISDKDVAAELSKLFSTLARQNESIFSQVQRVFAGMSGVDNIYSKEKMTAQISSFINTAVNVDNDAIIALYSGTLGSAGIVQIAGTGSITYGINNRNVRGRVGGRGYLIGERGSGFSLGSDGLDAAFKAYDGLQRKTEITNLLLNYFEEKALPDIVQSVYHSENVKEGIAALSKLVVEACDNGDSVANAIIRKNGLQMGEAIVCLVKKLFTAEDNNSQIPVVTTGGLFTRMDLFQPYIEEVFYKHMLDVKMIVPKMDPVGGAVVAALLKERGNLPVGFVDHFISNK